MIAGNSLSLCFLPALRDGDGAAARRELAGALAANGCIQCVDTFVKRAEAREAQLSTSFPGGGAFPHARGADVRMLSLALGRSERGIAWGEAGGRAHLVFMIAVPEHAQAAYLHLLKRIARVMKSPGARAALMAAGNVEELAAAWGAWGSG